MRVQISYFQGLWNNSINSLKSVINDEYFSIKKVWKAEWFNNIRKNFPLTIFFEKKILNGDITTKSLHFCSKVLSLPFASFSISTFSPFMQLNEIFSFTFNVFILRGPNSIEQ